MEIYLELLFVAFVEKSIEDWVQASTRHSWFGFNFQLFPHQVFSAIHQSHCELSR